MENKLHTKRLHKVSGFSPFGSGGYCTPDEAITAGKTIDLKRKNDLKLDIDPIRGKTVRAFHWSLTELSLEFAPDLYLILKSDSAQINAFVTTDNITGLEKMVDYELVYSAEMVVHWSPNSIARYFIGKEFTNIQLEYRFTWLYFKNSPKLLEVIQFAAQELPLPLLKWDLGT